jgi:hypothetical protein
MPTPKRRTYHLQVCPGDSLQGPSDEEIAHAIKSLPGGIPSFAILTKKKNAFMQAGGSESDGFQLEYQEFSRDGHWEHENSGNVPLEIVVQTLQWYAQDDDRWRTQHKWKRLVRSELEERNKGAWREWEESQPKKGFFKSILHGLLQIGLAELIHGKKKRYR